MENFKFSEKFLKIKEMLSQPFSYELSLLLLAFLIPLASFPNLYGSDAFQLLWMSQAITNGALNTEISWLISPLSFLGFFPYSHYPIGVPLILASLIVSIGFGKDQISIAVLIFDLFLLFFLWIGAKKISNELFDNEWERIILIGCFLFSPRVLSDTRMTISARMVLTIIIVFILLYTIKLLTNFRLRWILYTSLFFFFSIFIHRLWVVLFLIIFPIIIFVLLTNLYPQLRKLLVFLLIPSYFICFFFGSTFFYIDPAKISSPWFSNTDLLGLMVNLLIDYGLHIGLISIFLPLGIINLIPSMFGYSIGSLRQTVGFSDQTKNHNFNFFLLLSSLPLTFLLPSYYCIVLFLPLIVIVSVSGFTVFVKMVMYRSNQLVAYIPTIFFLVSLIYAISYRFFFSALLLVSFSILALLFCLLIIRNLKSLQSIFVAAFIDNSIWRDIQLLIILLSIVSFSIVTIEGRDVAANNPELGPWKNELLTNQEIELVESIKTFGVSGYIFVFDPLVVKKISGFGFLPALRADLGTGEALYYGLVTKEEVFQNLCFDYSGFANLQLFQLNPLLVPVYTLLGNIKYLNLSLKADYNTLKSYKIQYIITARDGNSNLPYPYVMRISNTSITYFPLFKTLPYVLIPLRLTTHLILWKVY